ncbi:MAG: DMT family transporter [Pseudomonadota bacterium]
MGQGQLAWSTIALLLLLSVIWGANMAAIKLASQDMSPLFMAGLRSLVASLCLWAWLRRRGLAVFPSARQAWHGLVVGILFGAEFACIYVGINHTLASRTVLLVYTAPFFVALGAHFWLGDDRLVMAKALGLLLAFAGVGTLFVGGGQTLAGGQLLGDALSLLAGVLWAATTLYIKRFLVGQARPVQTLFYQLAFSVPLLFLCSLIWEPRALLGFSWLLAGSLFYQCIIVAFLSFLWWFRLVDRYPVSLLHGFTFFTPILGVFLSGVILLGEPLTARLLVALGLVSLGMVLVNRQGRGAPRGA